MSLSFRGRKTERVGKPVDIFAMQRLALSSPPTLTTDAGQEVFRWEEEREHARPGDCTRYLTAAGNPGFSLHGVRLAAGASTELWYRHHFEANLILDGTLDVTDHATGDTHRLDPGALYLVGPSDRHRIETQGGVHLISVFNPPLAGRESHDEDGAYPPTGPIPPGPART